MNTYDLIAQITPGNRLTLSIPVPQSTTPHHYASLLAEQLTPDPAQKEAKGIHLFTVTIDEQEIEVAIEADSKEVANKIVCARCYNIIKTEAIKNTEL